MMLRPCLLLAALALAGCSDSRTKIVVYSPHGDDILREFEAAFEKAHPEADVQTFPMGSVDCFNRISGERANPACDVWWGAPSATFTRAAAQGLLEPYEPSFAAQLDDSEHDAQFRWCGQFAQPQVIIYNRDRMRADQAPKHWNDLAAPSLAGRVVMRFPLPSGSMRGAFSWIEAWKGEPAGFDWLLALHKNTKSYATVPEELFQAIAKDDAAVVSIWNLTDALFQADRYHYPFGISIPEEGVPVVIDCIGLVKKGSDDPARAKLAREFYEFATSLEMAGMLMKDHWRLLLRKDVPGEQRPSWQLQMGWKPLPVDPAVPLAHEDEWMERWDREIKPQPKAGG